MGSLRASLMRRRANARGYRLVPITQMFLTLSLTVLFGIDAAWLSLLFVLSMGFFATLGFVGSVYAQHRNLVLFSNLASMLIIIVGCVHLLLLEGIIPIASGAKGAKLVLGETGAVANSGQRQLFRILYPILYVLAILCSTVGLTLACVSEDYDDMSKFKQQPEVSLDQRDLEDALQWLDDGDDGEAYRKQYEAYDANAGPSFERAWDRKNMRSASSVAVRPVSHPVTRSTAMLSSAMQQVPQQPRRFSRI